MKNCQILNRSNVVPEERSPLQTIGVVCKLNQGEPEEKIREYLDIENKLFAFCVEFALENKLIIKQEDGRYEITSSWERVRKRILIIIPPLMSINYLIISNQQPLGLLMLMGLATG